MPAARPASARDFAKSLFVGVTKAFSHAKTLKQIGRYSAPIAAARVGYSLTRKYPSRPLFKRSLQSHFNRTKRRPRRRPYRKRPVSRRRRYVYGKKGRRVRVSSRKTRNRLRRKFK